MRGEDKEEEGEDKEGEDKEEEGEDKEEEGEDKEEGGRGGRWTDSPHPGVSPQAPGCPGMPASAGKGCPPAA